MGRLRLDRRAFLGGAATALAGTAGCLDGQTTSVTLSGTSYDPPAVRRRLRDRYAGEEVPGSAGAASGAPLDPVPAPHVDNPVLTAADVTDVDARFVADPFLFVDGGDLHLFFEVKPRNGHGVVGHATSADAGRTWRYGGVVLDPGYHLSYPLAFRHAGATYLLPEDGRDPADRLTLYRADRFPSAWVPVAEPVAPGYGAADHALFRRDGRWWLLVADDADDALYAHHSRRLEADGWTPHADNPVARRAVVRPAGRPLERPDGVLVFLQDGSVEYGNAVRAFLVTDLSPRRYADRELPASPVLSGTGRFESSDLLDRVSDNLLRAAGPVAPETAWNADRMHHLDAWYVGPEVGWLCAVDGFDGQQWSIGLYVASAAAGAERDGTKGGRGGGRPGPGAWRRG